MKAGGGKAKGGGWENEVGEKISLWLSHGQHKKLFCRTVGSGAQFTTHAKKLITAGQAGDLMSQDQLSVDFCSKFVVECKFWKNLELIKFFEQIGGKETLYEAMVKVKSEGESVGKQWWLVAKQNNRKPLLFMPTTARVNNHEGLEWNVIFTGTVQMFHLDHFLSIVNPELFLEQQQILLPQR